MHKPYPIWIKWSKLIPYIRDYPAGTENALQIMSLAAYASETNKISKMKKICGCVIQEMVSISSALSINNTVIASDYCNSILTRCWRSMIWSIVSVIKEKIVPTAVYCATNRLLLSDRWAVTVLESQFHCRYWCCRVLSELSPSPYKSTNEGLGNLHKSFYARSY